MEDSSLVHRTWGKYTWGFGDSEGIGPVMLAKIARKTGLTRENLQLLYGCSATLLLHSRNRTLWPPIASVSRLQTLNAELLSLVQSCDSEP